MQVRGADKVARLLTRPMVDAIEAGLAAVALEVQNELAPYPGQSGKPQPPKTERQRRYLHVLARLGGIPYRRSGDTGRGWKVQQVGSMRVVLSNTSKGAPWVYGGSAYHRDNWTQPKAGVDRVRPRVKGIMEAAIKAALRG